MKKEYKYRENKIGIIEFYVDIRFLHWHLFLKQGLMICEVRNILLP